MKPQWSGNAKAVIMPQAFQKSPPWYMWPHKDLGFIPERNHEFAVKVAGVMQEYNIEKVDYEDGEIIMELGAYVE